MTNENDKEKKENNKADIRKINICLAVFFVVFSVLCFTALILLNNHEKNNNYLETCQVSFVETEGQESNSAGKACKTTIYKG